MSDPKTENEITSSDTATEDGFFADISSMLDALVPPNDVTVTDINGKEHKLPGAISARKQVKVFREFKAIWKNEKVAAHLEQASDFGIANIISAVTGVAFEEEVMLSLGSAFKEAFPEACDGDPLDSFSIEEVVTALVPLFTRFIKRAGKTLMGLGELTKAA